MLGRGTGARGARGRQARGSRGTRDTGSGGARGVLECGLVCCWAAGCAVGALGLFLTRFDSLLFLSQFLEIVREPGS